MGTEAHVIALGPGGRNAVQAARRRLARLEARWTRFDPRSEIACLNAAGGIALVVSEETRALVRVALDAARLTAGRFDPTVLDALERAGYDRSFEWVEHGAGQVGAGVPAPGGAGIRIEGDTVTIPPGVRFDPGGIAKGYAADLVVAELRDAGMAGALVSIGGDLRAAGTPPEGDAWLVGVEHPTAGRLVTLGLAGGAVATSSGLKRAWGPGRHHVIDPSSGLPSSSDVELVTVVAEHAWRAEALAKAAFLAGADAAAGVLLRAGARGLLVARDGAVRTIAGLEALIVEAA